MFNSIFPKIHKEGYKFLAISIIATFIILLFSNFLGLIFVLLTIWVYYFFRDPDRTSINDDNYLKNQLIEFARFKTTINKSWDISHDLREFIVLIDKESNRDQIQYFSQKNKEFFSQMKLEVNNLKNEKKEKK